MTKQRWRGSLNSFSNHIAPEKEEQMRWMKIGKLPETSFQLHRRVIWDNALRPNRMLFKPFLLAQCYPEQRAGILWHTEWQLIRKIEEQVKNILKIMQNINHGNKERNLRKKAEAIQLIQEFQKQYESLYSLYTNLKEQVKKKVGGGDENASSTSGSDTESQHSQREPKRRSNSETSKVSESDYQESEASDSEDTTILKDKLTSSSEVTKTMNPEPESTFNSPSQAREVFSDLRVQEESEKTSQMLDQIKDLEGQVEGLKIEVSNLCTQKTQLEEQIAAISKEKECQFDSLGKQFTDKEQHYSSRISDLEAQADDMKNELNVLKHQKGELEERLLEETNNLSRISDLVAQADDVKNELNVLKHQKGELEERLLEETNNLSRISDLVAQADDMKNELNVLKNQKGELEERLLEETNNLSRISDLVAQADDMKNELNVLKNQKGELEERLLEETNKLSRISDLVAQADDMKNELNVLKHQKCELEERLLEETNSSSRISDLVAQADDMKNELDVLKHQKCELEERLLEETNSSSRISDLVAQADDMKNELDVLKHQKCELEERLLEETNSSSRISDLVAQADDMKNELNVLKHQKGELEERLLEETKQWPSKVNSLQKEVENVNSQKDELKLRLEKKSKETSEYLLQIEALKNELSLNEQRAVEEKERIKGQINDLELEIKSLRSKKSEQEEQVKETDFQPGLEKEKLLEKISELETSLSERKDELSNEQRKFKDSQTIASVQIKSLAEGVDHLKIKMESLQNEKECLQVELAALQNDKKLLQMELDKERENSSQLEKISKTNFQPVEKKVDELAEEFRKQYDDQLRIMSRRIKVAEQLQVECKEWYQKTRGMYEQETKEHKEVEERTEGDMKNVKDLTLAANDLLTLLDSQALKFEKSTGNLVNRISKASCDLNFAKQWAMRKNNALLQVRDDMDCLVSQLDEREGEMLMYREKVWKSENKVRELEKTIKDHEDGMIVLGEEKREAIRQLCVWIDYHRGRSDFYKKMLSEISTGRRRES